MKASKLIFLLALFVLTSCLNNKLIFQDNNITEFGNLDIKTAIKYEKKRHSRDITPDHLIGIGEGIYPNKNKYVLATPKTYEIKDGRNFKLETEYFYSINDSLVKVILYQWDYLQKNNSSFFENENFSKMFKVFQEKFDDLTAQLTKQFGEPVTKNIEQDKNKDDTFRDDIEWKNLNGLNAYLFMFGNNSNGYRQIRLAIYKD